MKFNRNKFGLKKNFIMFLCLLTIIFLTVIFCMVNVVLYKNVYSDYEQEASSRLNHSIVITNDIYSGMVDKEQNIINSSLVTDELRKIRAYDGGNINRIIESYDFLDKFFYGFTEFGNFNSEQIVIYLDGDNFPEGKYINRMDKLKNASVWEELEKAEGYISTWEYNDEYISVYRNLRYYDEYYGYLEIRVPTEKIINGFKAMNLNEYEKIEITDKNNSLLYSSNPDTKRNMEFVLTADLADGNTVTFFADKFYAIKNYYYYAVSFLIVFLIMLVICYFAYKYIVDIMTKDLYEFITNIQNSDKMLLNDNLIQIDGDKDVVHIKERFKELLSKNNQMHNDIERLYKEKSRVELNFLQSSINPHLLYNSLSAIKWWMIENGGIEMTEIIDDMTEYYRAVLSDGEAFISVQREIELIERYVQIIKTAYSIDIELTIDLEKEILDCYVIKLLLQPIVENAVVHGVNGIENASIIIKGRGEEEDMIFDVIDNGYGMDKETLLSLEDSGNKKKGFGLRNSKKRISVYYGKEYGISVQSEESKGTHVTVRVRRIDEKPELKGDI